MRAMGTRGARAVLCGVALLCALGLGQRPPGDPSCGPGSVLRGAGNDARCCGPCASGKALAGPARDAARGRAAGEPSGPRARSTSAAPGEVDARPDHARLSPGVRASGGFPTAGLVPKRKRRAVPTPADWVVSPWPSPRLLPAQFGDAAAPSVLLSASDLWLCVRDRWNVPVWEQISNGFTQSVTPLGPGGEASSGDKEAPSGGQLGPVQGGEGPLGYSRVQHRQLLVTCRVKAPQGSRGRN